MFNTSKLELFAVFKELTVAESKLALFGFVESSELVRTYGEELKDFRRLFFEGKEGMTEELLKSKRTELLATRDRLMQLLAKSRLPR
ncbi:hypothetical protein ACROAE_09230 [Shewanella sp. MF05960]|uniref:hypothetical protein n=1 Tax=Shewanella sp. MF05960 TaxID=3434874 RepID=UPI003D7917F7